MPPQNRIDSDRLIALTGSSPTVASFGDREPGPWNRGVDKQIDVPMLFRLWHTDAAQMPIHQIARRLGVAQATLYKHARKHHLPKRRRANEADRDRDDEELCPTPQEIEERAAYCRMMRERGTPIGGVE